MEEKPPGLNVPQAPASLEGSSKRETARLEARILELEKALEAKEKEIAKMKELVVIDDLTQIRNRRGFSAEAERLTQKMAEDAKIPVERRRNGKLENLTFLFLDLDDFKQVNDRLGHAAGDELLKKCAQMLSENTRDLDVVARISGDEFGIILIDAETETATDVAAKLQEQFLEIEIMGKRVKELFPDVKTGLSIGMASVKEEGRENVFNPDQLMNLADRAMYQTKKARK